MRLAGLVQGGYYPTPPRCVKMLAKLLQVQGINGRDAGTRELRILDPCCGPGDAAATLAALLQRQTSVTVRTYGVELERDRSRKAQEKLDHVLSADIFQTNIAHNAFQILFLNPPYDFEEEQKRVEHAFLTHCTRYLAENGLLAFIVPRRRLAVSARYLAAHYTWLHCRRFPNPEYDRFDQVILLGRRKDKPELAPLDQEMIMDWSQGPLENLPSLADPHGYGIPAAPTGEKLDLLFTRRRVDPAQAAAEARRTGVWASPTLRDRLWPPTLPQTRPQVPLRQGHLALLVAAGFLDNLCLETAEQRILVKGRTVKRMELVESNEDEEIHRDQMYTTIRTLDLDTGEVQDIESQPRQSQNS